MADQLAHDQLAPDQIAAGRLAAGGIRLEVSGPVASVTLARPQRRNAMTPSMWHALAAVPDLLPDGVRVVVVRGDGPSFCAGIDLRLFSAEGIPGEAPPLDPADPEFEQVIAGYQAGYLWLRDPAFVSVAVVSGHAIGAGFQLALSCDLRILADDARFCMKEPALGLVPDLTGTKPLADMVGVSRAIELCLTARTVSAGEALTLRLAELVVPASELDAAVADLVEALLATDAAAARATKELLTRAPLSTLEEQAAAERTAQARLMRARALG